MRQWELEKTAYCSYPIKEKKPGQRNNWLTFEAGDNDLALKFSQESGIMTIRCGENVLQLWDFNHSHHSVRVYKQTASLLLLKKLKDTIYKCRVLFKGEKSIMDCKDCFTELSNFCSRENTTDRNLNEAFINPSTNAGTRTETEETSQLSPSLLESIPIADAPLVDHNDQYRMKNIPGNSSVEPLSKESDSNTPAGNLYSEESADDVRPERVENLIPKSRGRDAFPSSVCASDPSFKGIRNVKSFFTHSGLKDRSSQDVVPSSATYDENDRAISIGTGSLAGSEEITNYIDVEGERSQDHPVERTVVFEKEALRVGGAEIQCLSLGLPEEADVIEVTDSVAGTSSGNNNRRRGRPKQSASRRHMTKILKKITKPNNQSVFSKEYAKGTLASVPEDVLKQMVTECLLDPQLPELVSKIHHIISNY